MKLQWQVRRDWGSALVNLWIVTEQLIEALWTREVVEPARAVNASKARKDQLTDKRAWTTATRIEMLHQKGVVDLPTLTVLSTARKARNDLAHRGAHPSDVDASACYTGVLALLQIVLATDTLPLLRLELSNHALSDPFAPSKFSRLIEPEFWLAIPKLPGEEELEKAEARIFSRRQAPASEE